MTQTESEIRTIMFVDLVGYTRKTATLTRDKFKQLHDTFDGIILPIFTQFQGKVINKVGDAYLATFNLATSAVHCGIALQKEFHKIKKLNIRVAIHGGEILHRPTGIYGDAVNSAARIEGITKPGDVVFSEFVFQAMNENEFKYQHLGLFRLKGLRYPVRLFKIKKKRTWWSKTKSALSLYLSVFLVIIIFVAGILWLSSSI